MCRQSKIIIPSFHSLFSSPGRKTQSAFLIKLFVVYIKLQASWLSKTFYIFTIIIFARATVPISTKLLTNYSTDRINQVSWNSKCENETLVQLNMRIANVYDELTLTVNWWLFIPRGFSTYRKAYGCKKSGFKRSKIAIPWHFVFSVFYRNMFVKKGNKRNLKK